MTQTKKQGEKKFKLTEKQFEFVISLLNAHSSIGGYKSSYAYKIILKMREEAQKQDDTK